MKDRVRIAQIGVNHPHAAGFRESLLRLTETEVVAFYDPHPATARPLLQPALQSLPLYDDLAALLEKEQPEAVLITLPNDLTPSAIVQAAQAGIHVFAEKPCARTADEFRPAAEAVRKARVQFATGYNRRFSPVGQLIKGMVEQGLLGRLVSLEGRWITTSVAVRDPDHFLFSGEHSGGGILHWLGCHWLDLAQWSTSSEVTEVAAILDTLSGEAIEVEDTASLSLRFSNGMIGSLHCAYVTDRAVDQLFFGLRGTLGWVSWIRGGAAVEARSIHPAWAAAPTRELRFEPDPLPGYGLAGLRLFIASLREGGRSPFTPDDPLRVLEILDAAHESSATGRRVALRCGQPAAASDPTNRKQTG